MSGAEGRFKLAIFKEWMMLVRVCRVLTFPSLTAFARAVLREPDGSAATTTSGGHSWFIRTLRLNGMVLNRSPFATAESVFHSATLSGVPLQCVKNAVVRSVIPTTVANAVFAVPGTFPALPRSARFVVPNADANSAISSILGYISNFFELGGVVFAALCCM
ncbi:hypothetical protein H9P43_006957 [Blastocladiella emersonii ATCC 22665]|nr:hypothetical protein H9P43_006957 [Blastocladiella emersonii ATCC 22665]